MKAVWVISLTTRDGRGGRKEPGEQTESADGYLSALALDPTSIHPVEVKQSVQFSLTPPPPPATPSQPARQLTSRLCQLFAMSRSPTCQLFAISTSPTCQLFAISTSPTCQLFAISTSPTCQLFAISTSPTCQLLPSPRNQPVLVLSLIHISEPTRRVNISFAVC